jgi:hypothetical protein
MYFFNYILELVTFYIHLHALHKHKEKRKGERERKPKLGKGQNKFLKKSMDLKYVLNNKLDFFSKSIKKKNWNATISLYNSFLIIQSISNKKLWSLDKK